MGRGVPGPLKSFPRELQGWPGSGCVTGFPLFLQGARGNDGATGAAGPPVSMAC